MESKLLLFFFLWLFNGVFSTFSHGSSMDLSLESSISECFSYFKENELRILNITIKENDNIRYDNKKEYPNREISRNTSSKFDFNSHQMPVPSNNKLRQTLNNHKVKTEIISEINNMAASSIPREYIVAHVGTHFPTKSVSELNDIVLSAIGTYGKNNPKTLQFEHAAQDAIQSLRSKYAALKKTHEHRKKLLENSALKRVKN